MRVLWLSNADLQNNMPTSTGTWILSMYHALLDYTKVHICANITWTNKNSPVVIESDTINHYYIPQNYQRKDWTPTRDAIDFVAGIIEKERPDIIHIWGTERFWGIIIAALKIKKIPVLVEIQGLLFTVGEYYFGGLREKQVHQMKGLLEYIYPKSTIENKRNDFIKWGIKEKELLQTFKNINTQSEWVRDVLQWITPQATIYKTDIILRQSFINGKVWSEVHKMGEHPTIFTITSSVPYKGMHNTLKAFSLIKTKYPKAYLRVAGLDFHKVRWKNNGYKRYLLNLCEELHIKDSVFFLGSLDEQALLQEMYGADVFITSTVIESYCLALAEALAIGMPCVAPFTSALPGLVTSGKNGLLFPPLDIHSCASKVLRLLSDEQLAKKIGNEASLKQRNKSNAETIALTQEQTYLNIVKEYGLS